MVQVIELVECEVFRFYYIILKQNGYQFSRRISCTLLLYELQTQNLVHKVPVSFTDQLPSILLTRIITAHVNYKPVKFLSVKFLVLLCWSSHFLWNYVSNTLCQNAQVKLLTAQCSQALKLYYSSLLQTLERKVFEMHEN
jgi:hypothetical protein